MGDREIPEGWERRADGDARIGAVIVGLRKKIRVSDYPLGFGICGFQFRKWLNGFRFRFWVLGTQTLYPIQIGRVAILNLTGHIIADEYNK
jgi:hypothetical protein